MQVDEDNEAEVLDKKTYTKGRKELEKQMRAHKKKKAKKTKQVGYKFYHSLPTYYRTYGA